METLTIVPTQAEAEMICALLRTAGIEAFQRQTNTAAGASDGLPAGGAREVLVAADDLDRAREVLAAQPEAT
jgi:Putative prokaryotic signal transducing protein